MADLSVDRVAVATYVDPLSRRGLTERRRGNEIQGRLHSLIVKD
jgi:hypothetical protein